MKRKRAARVSAVLLALAVLAGCASSDDRTEPKRDAAVKSALLRGVEQIRSSPGDKLRALLAETLASLRSVQGSTAAKGLAIEGFTMTLKGLEAQHDFYANDSGNIEAATRDAKNADRFLNRGANRLRAAGRALGIRIGKLNGR